MARVTHLYHYPVKGLSAQPLAAMTLAPGAPVPVDRVFALARPGSSVDPGAPVWAKKSQFVMLMFDEALAQIETHVDPVTLDLRVRSGGITQIEGAIGDRATVSAFEALILSLVPGLGVPPRLVAAPGVHFADKPKPLISLINLATVRAFAELYGAPIDPMRFRANIYVDGLAPWSEFGLVGRDIGIGAVSFGVYSRNGRCAATNVDPGTGARDRDIPGALRAAFGHKDLGIYLLAKSAGSIAAGDALSGAGAGAGDMPPGIVIPAGTRFICKGCYYVYPQAEGSGDAAAAIVPFSALPASWRCPDCGADSAAFSAHASG